MIKIVGVFLMGIYCIANADLNPVDRHNYIFGTQTIGGKYQFTKKARLIETSEIILGMGSNILKFRMGPRFGQDNYSGPNPGKYKTLTALAKGDASISKVFDMPFYYYFMWLQPMQKTKWKNGYSRKEKDIEYQEIYDLACYLLKKYNGSGKSFYFGHWEGDWLLVGVGNKHNSPEYEHVQNMIQWLNNRQKAVDDAKRDTPHSEVDVFNYTEVNLVRKGMEGKPCLTTEVLPHTSVDYVSYSSYEVIRKSEEELFETLDFIQKHIPSKKGLEGPRVFIGEFGFKIIKSDPEEQRTRSLEYVQRAIKWGCPFVLHWQVYDNEYERGRWQGFWLINNDGEKQPLFNAFKNYYRRSRAYVKGQINQKGVPPTTKQFRGRARYYLKNAE